MDVTVNVAGAVAGAVGVLLLIEVIAPEFLRLLVGREPRAERVRARSKRVMSRNGEVAERRALYRLALRVRRGLVLVAGFSIMGCAGAGADAEQWTVNGKCMGPEEWVASCEAALREAELGHVDPLVMEWVAYLDRWYPREDRAALMREAEVMAARVGGGVCDSTYTRTLFDGRSIPC